MMNFRLPFLAITLLITSLQASAQRDWSKYELGVNLGTYIYSGDLTPTSTAGFKTPGPSLGLTLSRQLRPSLALRGELNFGQLNGDDSRFDEPEWRKQRNFAFKTRISEATLNLVWSPVMITSNLRPYIFGGAGLALISVRRDYSNFNPEFFTGENIQGRLAEDISTKIPRVIPVIPVGIGLRYHLGERLSVNAEAAYRHTTTDYLDGYSKSANPGVGDRYFKYSVGLIYSFRGNKQWDCPVLLP
ncbi:MAG: porin family protein [Chitinophagaceae bacterium]|nr:MAG: porin family protein [Chitinophagaceae bacterium]